MQILEAECSKQRDVRASSIHFYFSDCACDRLGRELDEARALAVEGVLMREIHRMTSPVAVATQTEAGELWTVAAEAC